MSNKVFPKYHERVCDTYTPDFTASGEKCVLQTGNTTRSRLVAGGSFFRSVAHGGVANVNNITLECVVAVTDVTGSITTESVDLTITDAGGAITTIPTFTQKWTTGSPSCVVNGINQLRVALTTNPVVTMPVTDIIQPWDASTNDADCLLTSFGPVALSGAILPVGPAGIRTGPAFTLFHVANAETEADGSSTQVDAISEWDGTQWISHPSEFYEADSGSPALCLTGSP